MNSNCQLNVIGHRLKAEVSEVFFFSLKPSALSLNLPHAPLSLFWRGVINIYAFIFILLIPATGHAIGSVGVQPLTIETELSPNKKGEFEIEIFSTSSEDTAVHISLFDPVQKEDGSLDFIEAGKSQDSCSSWIKLPKTDLVVPAGETITLKGEIIVPRGASGVKIGTVMIEPPYEKKEKGISVRVRYAVIIKLKVKGKTIVESARFEGMSIKTMDDGIPVIEALVRNTSSVDFKARGQVILQDESGRIVETIKLTTIYLEEKKRRSKEDKKTSKTTDKEEELQTVYPGAKVAFIGIINKPLKEGEYTAILNMRYGKRSLSAKERLSVTKEVAEAFKKKERLSFEIKPLSIELKVPAGGSRTSFINVTNLSEIPLNVRLSLKDIVYSPEGERIVKEEGTTPYSLTGYLFLQDQGYYMGPRLSKTIPIDIKVPSEAKKGGRYGQLFVEVSSGDFKEQRYVDIFLVIPDVLETAAEVIKFETAGKNEDRGFQIEIKNLSSVHINPVGRIIIKDLNDNEYGEIALKLKQDIILPGSTGIMRGEYKKRLSSGKYRAIAEIDYGGKERLKKEIFFTVK